MNRQTQANGEKDEPRPVAVMKCEDIQAHLTDYMTRELGEAQSTLVREHLRKCETCRAESQRMSDTLALLRAAGAADTPPDRLSDKRRKRMMFAVRHPLIAWVDAHHTLVSLIVALAVIAVVLVLGATLKFIPRIKPLGPAQVRARWLKTPPATNRPPAAVLPLDDTAP